VIRVELPSIVEQLEQLPLQCSDPDIYLYQSKPRPSHFETPPAASRGRRRGFAAGIDVRYSSDRRTYMRHYMRARRAG
jgi:hypothetical protein